MCNAEFEAKGKFLKIYQQIILKVLFRNHVQHIGTVVMKLETHI
jgi:hypothetical protein